MKLKIEIETDNDAFEPNGGSEAARILRDVADRIDGADVCDIGFSVRDINGNRVGKVSVE